MTAAAGQLAELLSESIDAARERERTAFARAAGPHEKLLVLFGAGNLGRKTLAGLRQIGTEPLAFADNDAQRWGTMESGLPILSPAEAARRLGKSAAFIICVWTAGQKHRTRDLRKQLMDLGCTTTVPFGLLFWGYPELFLPHIGVDLPHKVLADKDAVQQAFACLADDASRAEYVAQLRFRLHFDCDGLPEPVNHRQYWPTEITRFDPHEHFVDCGALDGDTIADVLKHGTMGFDHLTAFEPDPANLHRLRAYISALPASVASRIVVHEAAVGARRERLRFNATGNAAAAVGAGGIEVQCVTLDAVLAKETPTYIKMDIEGSELDALDGAREVIGRCSPRLAVCVYHRQDHLWRVPLRIRQLGDAYRIYLRPYAQEGFELVCYGIPPAFAL